jgi:hypothetical protein
VGGFAQNLTSIILSCNPILSSNREACPLHGIRAYDISDAPQAAGLGILDDLLKNITGKRAEHEDLNSLLTWFYGQFGLTRSDDPASHDAGSFMVQFFIPRERLDECLYLSGPFGLQPPELRNTTPHQWFWGIAGIFCVCKAANPRKHSDCVHRKGCVTNGHRFDCWRIHDSGFGILHFAGLFAKSPYYFSENRGIKARVFNSCANCKIMFQRRKTWLRVLIDKMKQLGLTRAQCNQFLKYAW